MLAGFLLVLAIPATGPAASPGVTALKQKQASLEARSQAAVVELYGLESRLGQARSDLARVDAQAAALARRQATIRSELHTARRTMSVAERNLGLQLRYLYEQGEPDPIAVVLGATSLEDAINGLDAVNRATRATRSVLADARTAKRSFSQARADLAVEVKRTAAARARLAATEAGLEQARAERASYLVSLRQEQALTATQIGRLEAEARAATVKAQQVTRQAAAQAPAAAPAATSAPAAAPTTSATTTAPADTSSAPSTPPPAPVDSVSTATTPAPAAPPPPPRPGGTMTVYATGYCLRGTTATGLPVGPGIVATDPNVIPLGTRMTIPGYGEGVAADTGGAIIGKRIDVWIASCAKASAFTRTVTITFH